MALLLTSELVGNAVEHAPGDDIGLVVDRQPERLRVEVHDATPGNPTPRHDDPMAPRGRGLMLVERLSAGWGCERSPDGGKLVWFELRLPSRVGTA